VSLQRQSFDSMARSRMMSVATVPRFPPSLLRTLRLRTVPLWCFTHCSSTTIGIDSKFACTSLPSLPLYLSINLSIYQSISISVLYTFDNHCCCHRCLHTIAVVAAVALHAWLFACSQRAIGVYIHQSRVRYTYCALALGTCVIVSDSPTCQRVFI
jgi:hypothetical protein